MDRFIRESHLLTDEEFDPEEADEGFEMDIEDIIESEE
ncbi:MAG: hypothetical protein K940chlam1_00935 [Candidatus Anoxychlamydiales bacterium]|nr:hypothetical protein [Candidatus Anoxychlamydiales bacterium]NGX35441.1 hypothetical protein [Candidatus Anoxychlamydiales bacterium]